MVVCYVLTDYVLCKWFGDDKASEWSYLGARLRSAARLGGPDMSWGGYIVPRGPTGHVARGTPGLTMRALTMVGNGAVRPVPDFLLLLDVALNRKPYLGVGAQKGISYFELGCAAYLALLAVASGNACPSWLAYLLVCMQQAGTNVSRQLLYGLRQRLNRYIQVYLSRKRHD